MMILVDGIMASIMRLLNGSEAEYKIYNIVNSYPSKLRSMLQIIEDVLGSKAHVKHVDSM